MIRQNLLASEDHVKNNETNTIPNFGAFFCFWYKNSFKKLHTYSDFFHLSKGPLTLPNIC
jgi:hypothetical protein